MIVTEQVVDRLLVANVLYENAERLWEEKKKVKS